MAYLFDFSGSSAGQTFSAGTLFTQNSGGAGTLMPDTFWTSVLTRSVSLMGPPPDSLIAFLTADWSVGVEHVVSDAYWHRSSFTAPASLVPTDLAFFFGGFSLVETPATGGTYIRIDGMPGIVQGFGLSSGPYEDYTDASVAAQAAGEMSRLAAFQSFEAAIRTPLANTTVHMESWSSADNAAAPDTVLDFTPDPASTWTVADILDPTAYMFGDSRDVLFHRLMTTETLFSATDEVEVILTGQDDVFFGQYMRAGVLTVFAGGGNDRVDMAPILDSDGNRIREFPDFVRIFGEDGDDDITVAATIRAEIDGGAGRDTLKVREGVPGSAIHAIIRGGDGDDIIEGAPNSRNELHGDAGNDTLKGGRGDDLFKGGPGSDTYLFEREWGNDVIDNHDESPDSVDVISFLGLVSASEVKASRSDGNLILERGEGNRITVLNHFGSEAHRIDQVRFTDDSVWTAADLEAMTVQHHDLDTPGDTGQPGDTGGAVTSVLADIAGATIDGVSSGGRIVIKAADLPRSAFSFDAATGIMSVDGNGDGTPDATMTLPGDFSGGDFMAARAETGTVLSFHRFLPALGEQVAVAADAVNGITNQVFLTGNGTDGFRVTLNENLAGAAFKNALGVYEVDAAGNIVDARMLVGDVAANPQASVVISGVEAGNRLGFFLVQDGAGFAGGLGTDDLLSFVGAGGSPANVAGGTARLAVNGSARDLTVFHSFAATLNPDGLQHVLSGVDAGGRSMTIGFEDLLGGGDRDYQDVVFSVEAVLASDFVV